MLQGSPNLSSSASPVSRRALKFALKSDASADSATPARFQRWHETTADPIGLLSPLSLTMFSITSVNPQSLKTSAHPTNWAVKLQLREVALRLHLRRIRSELNERRQIDFLNNTTCRSFPHEVELRGLAGGSLCGRGHPRHTTVGFKIGFN